MILSRSVIDQTNFKVDRFSFKEVVHLTKFYVFGGKIHQEIVKLDVIIVSIY